MADNTTLNSGAGGDTLRTDDVGGGVKIPVSKIHTGADGVDGGPVTTSNPFPAQTVSGSLTALLLGGNATPVSLSNPLPALQQSGSVTALLVGGNATPVSFSNPLPVSGALGVLIGGVAVTPSNPMPVTGAVGTLVGGVQVSQANPMPVTGAVGITNAGVNVSRTNPLTVESFAEPSGRLLSGTTVRNVNYFSTNVAASGSAQLVAPQGAGNMIRVLSLFAMSNGTVIARVLSTGSAGSVTNLSGYIPLVANGGFVLPHNPHGWYQTNANEGLNLALNAAVNVGINITWIVS